MATANGLAAAPNREREEMLIIIFPLQSGRRRPRTIVRGTKPLSRRRGISEDFGSGTGWNGYTYVFRTLRFHLDDAEAADLFRHRRTRGRVPANRFARAFRQPIGERGNAGAACSPPPSSSITRSTRTLRDCAGSNRTRSLCCSSRKSPDGAEINPFYLSLLGPMVRRCADRGYDLLISFQQLSSDWHVDYEDSRKADGIILLGYGDYLNTVRSSSS